jgi:hypothetical protein
MIPAAVETKRAGIWLTRAVADGEDGEGFDRARQRHVVASEASDESTHDVDACDREPRHGIATHELAGTVHGPEELDLLLQGCAPDARGVVVDDAGRQVGVDGHLLARQGVQGEARGDFSDTARTARDDGEVHHQENEEDH